MRRALRKHALIPPADVDAALAELTALRAENARLRSAMVFCLSGYVKRAPEGGIWLGPALLMELGDAGFEHVKLAMEVIENDERNKLQV